MHAKQINKNRNEIHTPASDVLCHHSGTAYLMLGDERFDKRCMLIRHRPPFQTTRTEVSHILFIARTGKIKNSETDKLYGRESYTMQLYN